MCSNFVPIDLFELKLNDLLALSPACFRMLNESCLLITKNKVQVISVPGLWIEQHFFPWDKVLLLVQLGLVSSG